MIIEQTEVEQHRLHPKNGDLFDVVIIGAGPAGMSAAVCAGRARLKVLLIERALAGGQASTAYKISNYLGYPKGILGDQLSLQMEAHLEDYPLYYTRDIADDILNSDDDLKTIHTQMGNYYRTRAVIIAVGLEPKPLNSEFETRFLGRGVSYYAQGDVGSYHGKDVAVIGGGNCACYAAEFLASHVRHLYLIHRSDSIKAVPSLKEKVMNAPNITVIWNSDVVDAFGVDKVEKIKLKHVVNDQHTWLDVQGVFVYAGRIPPKEILHLNLRMDEKGYIVTDEYMRTSIRGIYAAGDIRSKQIRQIATAVSDGMIAAINVERDLTR
jgi:thioredoxin reductase (NADPH)